MARFTIPHIIEVHEETRRFSPLKEPCERDNSLGKSYTIALRDESGYGTTYVNVDEDKLFMYENRKTDKVLFGSSGYEPTIFKTIKEAQQWLKENLKCGDLSLNNRKHQVITIEGTFDVYESIHNGKTKRSYCKEEALRWFSNSILIQKTWGDNTFFYIEPVAKPEKTIDIHLLEYNPTTKALTYYQVWDKDNTHHTDSIFRWQYGTGVLGVVINHKLSKEAPNGQQWRRHSAMENCGYYGGCSCVDIRRDDTNSINVSNGHQRFSTETMRILKSVGIPTVDWSYNSYGIHEDPKRINCFSRLVGTANRFLRSDDLPTDRSKEICAFLKDIPFDEEHSVVPFKNGFIARFGRIAQAFQETWSYRDIDSNVETCEVTSCFRQADDNRPESALIEEHFVEGARLWISNNFDIRSVCVSTCCGTKWKATRIDLINSKWSEDTALSPANPQKTNLGIDLEQFNKNVYKKLCRNHPKLKWMEPYMDKHPCLYRGYDISFLRSLFEYQVIIAAFQGWGMDDIFWSKSRDDKETWHFDDFKEKLNLQLLPHHHGETVYQALGMTKAQFKLIFKNPDVDWEEIINVLRSLNLHQINPDIPESGWRSETQKINVVRLINFLFKI